MFVNAFISRRLRRFSSPVQFFLSERLLAGHFRLKRSRDLPLEYPILGLGLDHPHPGHGLGSQGKEIALRQFHPSLIKHLVQVFRGAHAKGDVVRKAFPDVRGTSWLEGGFA